MSWTIDYIDIGKMLVKVLISEVVLLHELTSGFLSICYEHYFVIYQNRD